MTTSQEARIANRKRVLDVIEHVTTNSSIRRPDLAEAVFDAPNLAEAVLYALEDAELLAPYGEFAVHFGSPLAATEIEDWPDGVRVERNGSQILAYIFPADAIISEE